MKKICIILSLLLCMSIVCGIASAATGPAPNSGDCIPDGSGFEDPPQNPDSPGVGPAPNCGDGISDGSGF